MSHGADIIPAALAADELRWAGLALLLPAAGAATCGLCAALRIKGKLSGWLTTLALAASFCVVLKLFLLSDGTPLTVHLFDWMQFDWADGATFHSFTANFTLYIDSLSLFWMLFVTGLGTLISLYATEYMEHEKGAAYARFFAGIGTFLFAMSALVMGGNLVMLYLGWEGVGLASYLLIGYFYTRPSAVAAAKKAFIVNRIGDLGLAIGIWLIWDNYGTLEYDALWQALAHPPTDWADWEVGAIPFLLMAGAFGKSAQIPLYVWLPDAMEGPTPVSALIHAATMVTAGVYLIARLYPLFLLHPDALPTVAWIGGSTALLAATIGMAQYDIKRVFAYSTISQLGYMFLGLGVGTTFGACEHTFTHAFFKALLFLSGGAVMHGFAGQLDLRKISGLRRIPGFGVVAWTMLVGCLWLAAFPYTSAFFSKDEILLACFTNEGPGFRWLGWLGLATAGMTAYYAFRVWFRVCAGPVQFEPGEEHHADHGGHGHSFHPHGPRWAMSGVLLLLATGAILSGIPAYRALAGGTNWVQEMVGHSSAAAGAGLHGADHQHNSAEHGVLGMSAHTGLAVVGSVMSIGGILAACYLHLLRRSAAESLRGALLRNPLTRWIPIGAENKWFVDEFYHWIFRAPLWIGGKILSFGDRHFLDGVLVDGSAKLPAAVGRVFKPLYAGAVQAYALTMAGGIALVMAWVVWVWMRAA